MKKLVTLICSIALLGVGTLVSGCSSKHDIVIGSKNFTEQLILGPMLQILIEENTDLSVKLSDNMSGMAVWNGIKNGEIDAYIDYTGTIYGDYFSGEIAGKTAQEIFDLTESQLKTDHNITLLDSLGFNNTYVFAVTQETSAEYNMTKISDMIEVMDELVLGCNAEFPDRADTLPMIESRFGKKFDQVQILDYGARYTALVNGNTQVCDAFSTDGMLIQHDLFVLEDDIDLFPPYHAVPLIRDSILEDYPELQELLSKLVGVFTDASMAELNKKVDVDGMSEVAVAREFLEANDLI